MKTCGRCRRELAPTNFHRRSAGKDGLQSYCKDCGRLAVAEHAAKNRPALRERERELRANRPLAERRYREQKRYGLAAGEYEAMLLMQGGRCAICGSLPTHGSPLHIDHDHKCCAGRESCGECVRGLVCRLCNWMLGNSQDTAYRLRAGAEYLERYCG